MAQGVQPVWQLHVPVRPTLETDGSILAGKLRIKPTLLGCACSESGRHARLVG
ncbi:hypothetical protein LP420_14880 [Massilia sp. B-10]|nr:hypothetical protein LP420_14880 [Massilia sp. B-10]UUZ56285.1 hypothetical protein LP419_14305 [Massilia sp. H-1]